MVPGENNLKRILTLRPSAAIPRPCGAAPVETEDAGELSLSRPAFNFCAWIDPTPFLPRSSSPASAVLPETEGKRHGRVEKSCRYCSLNWRGSGLPLDFFPYFSMRAATRQSPWHCAAPSPYIDWYSVNRAVKLHPNFSCATCRQPGWPSWWNACVPTSPLRARIHTEP